MTVPKTLLLLRHATPIASAPTDIERSLTAVGEAEATAVGRYLLDQQVSPDLILSSTALRARQTIEIVSHTAAFAREIRFESDIYTAAVSDLLEVLKQIPAGINSLLLVGHNPAIEDLLRVVTGETEGFRPATIARVSIAVPNWNDIGPETGTMEWLVKPGEFASG